jgi:hypothetical protein
VYDRAERHLYDGTLRRAGAHEGKRDRPTAWPEDQAGQKPPGEAERLECSSGRAENLLIQEIRYVQMAAGVVRGTRGGSGEGGTVSPVDGLASRW